MNTEERERQEKILAKLQWLNERSKRDFKGNPPPFEEKKTLKSVESQRRQVARALAGDTDFLPFWHGPTELALDATRTDYLKGLEGCEFKKQDTPKRTFGGQLIDSKTGLTEVQLALSWNVPHESQTTVSAAAHSDKGLSTTAIKTRRGEMYIRSLPPRERAAAFRAHILEHPKCVTESASMHRRRWVDTTQLGVPIAPPPPRPQNTALKQHNSIRLVHMLSNSQ